MDSQIDPGREGESRVQQCSVVQSNGGRRGRGSMQAVGEKDDPKNVQQR